MTAREALIALLAAIAFLGYWRWDAKRDGKIAQQVVVADSVHRADSVKQVVLASSAASAKQEADSLRRLARLEVARETRRHAQTDSQLSTSSEERAAALRAVADSGATLDALRARILRLTESGVADSVAVAAERTAHDLTVRALLRTIATDSTALQRHVEALNGAVARATAAENLNTLYKRQRPSLLSRCGLSAGYGATDKGLGPAVLLGCKIAP